MNVNAVCHTQAGRRHLALCQPNQDSVAIFENETVIVAANSDGASGSPAAEPAAQATVEAAVEFLSKPNIWMMKPKQLKEEFLKTIDKHYLAAPYPYSDLTATMAAVAVNKISGQFLAVSVGDCAALVLDNELNPSILLSPKNLMNRSDKTIFCNGQLTAHYLKIESGNINQIAGFVLLTDGANNLLQEATAHDIQRLAGLTVLNPAQAQTDLETYINETLAAECSDDITVSVLMIADDPEIIKIAGVVCPAVLPEPEPEPVPPDAEDSILTFLKNPRTAEELVQTGYVKKPEELLTFLMPLITAGVVEYQGRCFRLKGVTLNGTA